MADISTTYMGIALKSPVVVAACSLSGKMDKVRQAEESGAGALVASTLFRNGVEHIATMNSELAEWMDGKSYASLADCRGKLSAGNAEGDTSALERAHYLDYVLQPGKG